MRGSMLLSTTCAGEGFAPGGDMVDRIRCAGGAIRGADERRTARAPRAHRRAIPPPSPQRKGLGAPPSVRSTAGHVRGRHERPRPAPPAPGTAPASTRSAESTTRRSPPGGWGTTGTRERRLGRGMRGRRERRRHQREGRRGAAARPSCCSRVMIPDATPRSSKRWTSGEMSVRDVGIGGRGDGVEGMRAICRRADVVAPSSRRSLVVGHKLEQATGAVSPLPHSTR